MGSMTEGHTNVAKYTYVDSLPSTERQDCSYVNQTEATVRLELTNLTRCGSSL